MKPVLIVQNDPKEGAGQLTTLLSARGLKQERVFGYDTDYDRVGSAGYAALVVLGGAQSAYETETYPYLAREMALCQDFMQAGKPIAGFCLGAQILARTLGGEVVPGAKKEIGWYDLTLTEDGAGDALLTGHPKTLLAYHFHGDRIENVPGATNLASSVMTPCQLFRYGSNVYGFQYHAEVDEPLVELMCRNNADYMAANGFDAETIIGESRRHLPIFAGACKQILDRWIDLIPGQAP
ncbi:MAG: type 1 glutamine amidotransferase [Methyloceanibacter sp.]|uniref:type 1 glutamine amidotransferase n=1 Tax=Methyloceanibacter sp. TaxID=1965321 RepID=UPI003D6D41B4